jgi:ABC-2 type transport system permease protein
MAHPNTNLPPSPAQTGSNPLLRFILPAALVLLVGIQFWISLGFRQELSRAQGKAEQVWQNAPARFPLDILAAPFYAPAPATPLALFDSGEGAWLGQTIWLQAGRLARSQDQFAYDYIASGRFLNLTAGSALQILIPALALFLTWRLKLSGKLERSPGAWMNAILQVFETVGPALSIACLAVGLLGMQQLGLDGALRLMMLVGVYMLYAAAATSLCLAVFLWVENGALAVTLLAFLWCFNFTLARPVSTNLAASMYPLPTLEQFARKLEVEARNGYNGVEPKADRDRRFVQETLVEYKVKEIQALPVNLSAVILKREEEHQREIFLRRIEELRDQMLAQERVQGLSALLFPHVAIQIASAALSGTDAAAERTQQRSADEQWSRIMKRVYSDVVASSGPEGKMVPRGPEYWRQIPFVRVDAAPVAGSVAACLYPLVGMLLAIGLCAWQVMSKPAEMESEEAGENA